MLLPLLALPLSLLSSGDGCLPDGGVEPALEGPLDPRLLRARLGDTLADLVERLGPHSRTSHITGEGLVYVQPLDGSALPTTLRIPVQAPPPFELTLVVDLGERRCLPVQLSSVQEDDRPATLDDGMAYVPEGLEKRVELRWRGRTLATHGGGGEAPLVLYWDADRVLLDLEGASIPPLLLHGARDPERQHLEPHHLPEDWVSPLVRAPWPSAERAALIAELARLGFGSLSLEAQAAMLARADWTSEERARLGIPPRRSGSATATLSGVGVRVAIDGVEARGWVQGPERRAVGVPARGLSLVTLQSIADPDIHFSFNAWLTEGVEVYMPLHQGPVVISPDAPRCGRVFTEGWTCNDTPLAPGEPFNLRCPAPFEVGHLTTLSASDAGPSWTFLPAAPGLYEVTLEGGAIRARHTEESCPEPPSGTGGPRQDSGHER